MTRLSAPGTNPSAPAVSRKRLACCAKGGVDLIVSDYRMPGVTGLEFLSLLADEGYDVPLIMLTGYGSIEHAVASIKAGAIDYITKPIRPQQLEVAVEHALEFVRLRRENESLRREVMELRNERQIIGESTALRRILQTVAMAARTRATVLLQGESGTGKELFARAVCDQSDRADKPFVKLELRGASRRTDRERAVRSRARRVHGRNQAGRGRVRAGARRHAPARRSQRDAPRSAGETSSRAAGAGVRARRRHDADQGRRAHHRDDQPRSRGRSRGRHVPSRSLLSSRRHPDSHSAAARAPRGHSAARDAIRDQVRARYGEGSAAEFHPRRCDSSRRSSGREMFASCSMRWNARSSCRRTRFSRRMRSTRRGTG